MAFDRDYFNLVGPSGGRGPRLWTYIEDNTIGNIDADDYFLEVADEVRAGDVILVIDIATGTIDNPTTNTSVTWLVVVTAVGKKDGGTATVTTFANALSLA